MAFAERITNWGGIIAKDNPTPLAVSEQVNLQKRKKEGVSEVVLRAATRGDNEAFTKIYETYNERILRFCISRVPFDYAEDSTQTAWERVYKKMPRFEAISVPAFSSYLFTTAYHVCAAYYRERAMELGYSQKDIYKSERTTQDYPNSSDESEARVEFLELTRVLRDAINALPGRERKVVKARLRDDLRISEIALREGTTLGAVKAAMHRGITVVREKLSEYK